MQIRPMSFPPGTANSIDTEMDDRAHKELLDVLISHKGPVLLSGYDNDLYNDRLAGWHKRRNNQYYTSREKRQQRFSG